MTLADCESSVSLFLHSFKFIVYQNFFISLESHTFECEYKCFHQSAAPKLASISREGMKMCPALVYDKPVHVRCV